MYLLLFRVPFERSERTAPVYPLLAQDKQAVHDVGEDTFRVVEEFPDNSGLIRPKRFKLGGIADFGNHIENTDVFLFNAITYLAPFDMLDSSFMEMRNFFFLAFGLSSAVMTAPFGVNSPTTIRREPSFSGKFITVTSRTGGPHFSGIVESEISCHKRSREALIVISSTP